MLAFLVVLVLGVLIGWARGGRVRNMGRAPLRLLVLVWVAAGLQVAAQFVPSRWSIVAYGAVVISYAVLFAFAGANWKVPGMLFIAVGAAMNYAVILANQGMPISADAAARAGFTGQASDLVLRGKHFVAADGDASLWFLGDVIPLWRQPAVASVGDIVIWAGLILLVQELMRERGRATRKRRAGGSFIELPAAHQLIDLTRPAGEQQPASPDPIDTEADLASAVNRVERLERADALDPDEPDEETFPH